MLETIQGSYALNVDAAPPKEFNYGRDVVDRWAREADKEALICVNSEGFVSRYKFSDIARESNRWANLLVKNGARKGDRILVMLPRIAEWHVAMIACLKIGAIPIPAITMLTSKDVRYRVAHSGARGAITTSENVHKFPEDGELITRICVGEKNNGWVSSSSNIEEAETFECEVTLTSDPAILYYTSGSTGNPKGVLHTVSSLEAWPNAIEEWMGLTREDVKWNTADTGWAKAATGSLFGQWRSGACVLFYDGPFDPAERLRIIRSYGVTIFCAAATEFRHIVQLPEEQLKSLPLRIAASAGEAVNPEVAKRWSELTATPLLEAFGQSETLMTIVNSAAGPNRAGSIGRSAAGLSSVILTEERTVAPPAEVGNLALRLPAPQFMEGYYKDPTKTQEAIVEVGGARFWLTGDLAWQDEDGYFFYAGRADDIISSAGYRIGPNEVENALMEHPDVLECAVVGSPDEQRGAVVKAFIVLKKQGSESPHLVEELQDHCKKTTAPYKYPRLIEFVEELPKNPAGKVLRRVLRAREAERASLTQD